MGALPLLLGVALGGAAAPAPSALNPEDLFETPAPHEGHLAPATARERSKKERWLLEKITRPDVHVTDAALAPAFKAIKAPKRPAPRPTLAVATTSRPRAGTREEPVVTLFNLRTREALPLRAQPQMHEQFRRFLRDHYTNQATEMDVRLLDVLADVARKFSAQRIDVVSGYRSPKYNLMLRKKGHEVARQSQHTEGNAVDFRIRGVPTTTLLKYVRSLRRGGVGYYPASQFVHADTGRIRYWKGT